MTPQNVYDHYGSTHKFNKETGISKSLLSYWIKRGYVPLQAQVKLYKLTKGVLKIDLNLDD